MFVVSLSYLKGLSEVDKHIDAHLAYLNKYYALGVFLASGKKVPRTGGVILMQCDTRARAEEILSEDPFHQAGVAKYDLIEFVPSKAAPGLERLID